MQEEAFVIARLELSMPSAQNTFMWRSLRLPVWAQSFRASQHCVAWGVRFWASFVVLGFEEGGMVAVSATPFAHAPLQCYPRLRISALHNTSGSP